jgi:hypothetical protein
MQIGRLELTGDAEADLVYFHTYSSERSINTNFSVRGDVDLHRFTLFAEDRFLNTRERPNFEIDARSRRLRNDLRAGARVDLLSKLAVEVAGRTSIVEYDQDATFLGSSLREQLNRDERAVSATLRYAVTPLTTIVVAAEAEESRFPFSPVRNTESVRIVPGVEFTPQALLSGSAHVGYRRFQSLDDALPDFSGLVAAVRLAYTFRESTIFTVTADRDVDYSFETFDPYFVVDGVGGGVRRRVGGRFDVSVGYRRDRYSYRRLIGVSAAGVDDARRDVIDSYSASVGYGLRRGVRIGFGGTYFDRESNRSSRRNYQGLRLGTSVTYGF